MDVAMLDFAGSPDLVPGLPTDEIAATVAASDAFVSLHLFRTPPRSDGSTVFLYEHVRCARTDILATGGSVIVRTEGGERVVRLDRHLSAHQVDVSGDRPYADRGDLAEFVSARLAEIRKDAIRLDRPRLMLRENGVETRVDARALVLHAEGLFRIGHGWLMRWEDVADVRAPRTGETAADLRIYAVDGRAVVVRVDVG